jgi:hypothetical protein
MYLGGLYVFALFKSDKYGQSAHVIMYKSHYPDRLTGNIFHVLEFGSAYVYQVFAVCIQGIIIQVIYLFNSMVLKFLLVSHSARRKYGCKVYNDLP